MLSIAARESDLREPLEVLVEAFAQRAAIGTIRAGAREDHEIPRRQLLVHPKAFPGEPLELVAIDRSLGCTSRDRQTKPRDRTFIGASQHREVSIVGARRIGEDSPELGRCVQTLSGGEPCRVDSQRGVNFRSVRARDGRGLSSDGWPRPYGRRGLPSAHENRECACGADCSVEKDVSWCVTRKAKSALETKGCGRNESRELYAACAEVSIPSCTTRVRGR